MAIDNAEVIDATAYEGKKLILQLYDHLEFDDEIIKEHMFMLQDKLNTYIWFIDSKQMKKLILMQVCLFTKYRSNSNTSRLTSALNT